MGYLFITTVLFPFFLFLYIFRNKKTIHTNLPIVGMLPSLLKNLHRLNDINIRSMEKYNLTCTFNGPWFTDMHYVITADPLNVNHISCKSFRNYGKGSKLKEILNKPFGSGILNADSTLWQYQRNVALLFFNNPKFNQFLVNVSLRKLEHGLMPILDHASRNGIVIDMQDIFFRFMYDTMSIILMDHDLMCLSVDLPSCPILKAVADIEHGLLYRHVIPTFGWKLLWWLNVGYESKSKQANKILDNHIYKCINNKRQQRHKHGCEKDIKNYDNNELSADLLTFFMDKEDNNEAPISNDNSKFLRDIITNFLLAGAETTSLALSWFFCIVSQNPQVLEKIKEEMQQVTVQMKNNDESLDVGEINKLIYLHATLFETMRLYPSLIFNPKSAIKSDILPSSHPVQENTEVIINIYAMGRSKLIWGDDCNEFKPERWITQDGKVKHEPSYKFFVFGSGPRSCLGKQMALTLIKILAVKIFQDYKLEALEMPQIPQVSMNLRMKRGFKVKVFHT